MSPEQLVGKSLNELFPREQAEAFWKDDLEIIASGNPKSKIIESINIEGQKLWIQTDKIPYMDSEGNIVGIIGFTFDITQRKRAEEEREKLIAGEQAALAEAEAARKLDRLKSEFLQTMSHELRTPMNAIIGFNAIKFSKPQGGTITISGRKTGEMAQFSICDTGIGIKEEDLGKLFSLFYQADSGLSRKYGGTGIGLSIIKKLIEQHGGRIWVKSEYGEGTTFKFTLPLKACDAKGESGILSGEIY